MSSIIKNKHDSNLLAAIIHEFYDEIFTMLI
jgi:hypothetical protein